MSVAASTISARRLWISTSCLDRTMDKVRARFGRGALGHAAVVFREEGGVPDAFRELAEADGETQ